MFEGLEVERELFAGLFWTVVYIPGRMVIISSGETKHDADKAAQEQLDRLGGKLC